MGRSGQPHGLQRSRYPVMGGGLQATGPSQGELSEMASLCISQGTLPSPVLCQLCPSNLSWPLPSVWEPRGCGMGESL